MQIDSASSAVDTDAITSPRGRIDALCAWALAVPPVVVLAVFAASGISALIGGQPLVWPAQDVTLTEAVGMHDTGEFVRQISLGANPNLRYDAWNILKLGRHVRVTPLEAAVATRESY